MRIDAASVLALLFAAALVASLLVKFWLASRQMRHVAAHRDRVPVAFAGTIALAAHQRAADYTLAKSRFGLLTTAFGVAVLLGWTLLGGLDALNGAVRDAVQPRFGNMAYQLALLAAFVVIGSLLDAPFDAYSTFRLEQRFGFNRTSWKLYLADAAKGAVIGALIGLPLATGILWIMAGTGGFWWLWAWAAWVVFNALVLVLYPTVIAPLFNKFEPLADESLKARVQALMAKCGFSAKGLFVMDGSRRSAHANAYFTGFGAAKRVVFFDTLLGKLSPGEVEAVLAHELGHFKHRHVVKRLVSMFAISGAGFALLGWLSTQTWFYTGLAARPSMGAPNDALALLLFGLVVPVFGFFVSPLFARLSRRHEFEADAYACAQADGRDLAAALLKLHQDNAATLTPDPVYARFTIRTRPPANGWRRCRGSSLNDPLDVGLVVAGYGRHYIVEAGQGDSARRLICHPRGKKSDCVVGDRVQWRASGDEGVIERIEPRRNLLFRQDEWKTKAFAANLDRIFVMVAGEPVFSESQLARALIAAESAGIDAAILLNKVDLPQADAARARLAPYVAMGYDVIEVALKARPDAARALLTPRLAGGASLVLGPSGTGKSTLINLLAPDARAQVGEVSQALNSGRHTTTTTQWYWLDAPRTAGLIDSPGFQEFGLKQIDPQTLPALMPDLREPSTHCRFYNCTHLQEPGCGVRDALGRGEISESRYRIYGEIVGELARR